MQTDYIMRQIQQFAEIMAVILGLKESRRYRATLTAIDEALATLLGMSSDDLSQMPTAALLRRLTLAETTVMGREKTLFVAALLREAGDIHRAQDRVTQSYACHLQALHLLLDLRRIDTGPGQPDTTGRVAALRDRLGAFVLPPETLAALHHYYEATGAYARSEDMLFELLDATSDAPEIVAMGVDFYARLRQRSDADLAAGNLPRDEVEAGLAEVRARGDQKEAHR